MSDITKEWLSIDDQIEKLRSRGLIIDDEQYPFISNALTQFGYYEIVNGYRQPFLVNGEHDHFIPGTNFFQLYYLFEFDQVLRDATLSAIEMFELTFRQAIARVFSKNHTERQEAYLSFSNYRAPRGKPDTLARLIRTLANIAYSNLNEPFAHYRNEYGNVPPWIVVKGLDFGGLKSWYTLLKPEDKQEIVQDLIDMDLYENMSTDDSTSLFSSFISIMHQFRNRAAHGGRMYNYFPVSNYFDKKTNEYKPFIKYRKSTHQYMRVTPSLYRIGYGQSGVWLLLKLFALIDNKDIFEEFSEKFEMALENYFFKSPGTFFELQKEMFIPKNDIQYNRALYSVLIKSYPLFARYDMRHNFVEQSKKNLFALNSDLLYMSQQAALYY